MSNGKFIYTTDSSDAGITLKTTSDYLHKSKIVKAKEAENKRIDIYEACCKGLIDFVKCYFGTLGTAAHLQVNKRDKDDFSLLHHAARFNRYYIVKILIHFGADVNATGGPERITPLHLAARYKTTSGTSLKKRVLSADSLKIKADTQPAPHHHKLHRFRIKDIKHSRLFKSSNERSFDSQGVLIPERHTKKAADKKYGKEYKGPIGDSIINALVTAGCDLNARDKNDATPLHYAAMARNVSAFEELMSYSVVNIECKDSHWMTPLHYAAEQGCLPIAQMLLENGAAIMTLNKCDMTPLHLACEEDHPDVVHLLLQRSKQLDLDKVKEFINYPDRNNHTALHYASMSGNQQLVSLLLENEAACLIPNTSGNMTPLHYACAAGNVEIVKLLVLVEPNLINERNFNMETPLHVAALLNRYEIVKFLLEQNAEIDSIDRDNETPMFVAAKKDHYQIVKVLHEEGASLNVKNSEDYTPFHIAAYSNSLKTLEYFLSLNQSANLQNTWDYHENRPIHLAVLSKNVEVVKLLIANEAPVESKNDTGLTPLLLAASKGYIEIMKLLVEFCPPLALDEDDSNNTALHLAAENGFFKAVPILVDSGVPVDNRNTSQMSALDLACFMGHVKTVVSLLDAEATVNTPENSKLPSPLLISAKNGHAEVLSLLINRGANINKVDSSGRNCLDIAIDENRKDAVMAILNSVEWENSLRHVSLLNGVNYSPLRRLVDIMPDVAEFVLDKCMTNNSLPRNHPKYQIFCNYEFIEDMHTTWGSKLMENGTKDYWKQDSPICCYWLRLVDYIRAVRYKTSHRTHPLSMIVDKNRTPLIRHPLVRYLVRDKWNRSSFYLYYFRLALMLIHLFFFTGLCVTAASPPYPCITNTTSSHTYNKPMEFSYYDNMTNCIRCPPLQYDDTFMNVFFIKFGKAMVILTGIMQIMIKIITTIINPKGLLHIQAIMELIAAILSLVFASTFFNSDSGPFSLFPLFRCTNNFRSIGAVSICLTWLSFVLYLTKLPKIGIYVVMYMDIFRTFLQFMPVYFMLILSFSIPFYMLFLDRYQTNAYVTPFKAMMKTLVSTVGEIEYDTFYNTLDEPPLNITYFVLFLFILSNSIILMNLLVGLAVDDIQGVQSKAFIKRLALQILMTMEFEKVIPDTLMRRYVSLEESIFPNEYKNPTFWSWWEFKSNPFLDDKSTEDISERMENYFRDTNQSLKTIKHQLKIMTEKYNKIEGMFEELLRRTQENQSQ